MKYRKLDPISHILLRPDMYVGTVESKENDVLVYKKEREEIVKEENVMYNDGIVRCFTEAISNAIDNFFRSVEGPTPMTRLEVKFDEETQMIEMINDGNHIPVRVDEEHGLYIPEMVFGYLLSSSNYNDNENRISSGRNGLGIKLLNVFSEKFEIECYDKDLDILYKQEWNQNMKLKKEPILERGKKYNYGYTKIKWLLDFSKFKLSVLEEGDRYSVGMIQCFQKILIDASMMMGISVKWNEEKFMIRKFVDYCKYFCKGNKSLLYGSVKDDSFHVVEYCIVPSCGRGFEHVSFVNGIYTTEGGSHVDFFSAKFFNLLHAKLKKYNLSMKELRRHFTIFLKVFVSNPVFSSQSKTKLVSSKKDCYRLIQFEEKDFQKILKWDVIDNLKQEFEIKKQLALKQTEKKRGFKSIHGYDKANFAGTKKSKQCSLILCEGLSAKTFATKGITKGFYEKKGRDYFGIFPLKGKPLNVKNSSMSSLTSNEEIKNIIQILNLKFGVDYEKDENFSTLCYGDIIILTDADVDGMHICGLIINIFSSLFPSLLQRSFLKLMMTPIAKIKVSPSKIFTFYNEYEYQKKLEELNDMKHEVKYFKGLGTSNDDEIKESFAEKVVQFVLDEKSIDNLNLVFLKSMTNERKNWLLTVDEKKYVVPQDTYPISQFLYQDFMKFSIDDNKRSIPMIFDGLKPSQRKILYSVFKKNLHFHSKSLKVAQLAAYTAECSSYHHGEQNLCDTIIKLTHDFVGANNINLLFADGQFGTRIQNGKDCASPRYIYTKLSKITSKLFILEDEPLLLPEYEDGQKVEPIYYMPIVPLILVNGCKAIGTGWSSFIPNFNVHDIIKKLMYLIQNNLEAFEEMEIFPYYKNFQGIIEKQKSHHFVTKGILLEKKCKTKTIYQITEIPIGESIDNYKSYCEKLVEDKIIKNFQNFSSSETILFQFEKHEGTKKSIDLDTLKLKSNLFLSNMVLFQKDNKIKKYNSIDDIILDFYDERILFYEKRIESNKTILNEKINRLQRKAHLIEKIIDSQIHIYNKSNDEILSQILNHGFSELDFDLLINLPLKSMTREYYSKLLLEIKSMKAELEILETLHPKQIWEKELMEFSNSL